MRHKKAGRKFNRDTSARRALLRALAGNLVLHERIETTEAKAKELRRIAERLITRAARLGDELTVDTGKLKEADRVGVVARQVAARRQVAQFLPLNSTKTLADGTTEDVDLIKKLFETLAPRYMPRIKAGKGGGYTRITKKLNRRGDNSPMAIIEILPADAA